MRGTEVDAITASYAEGVRDERERAESKMAIWRETLEKCVEALKPWAGQDECGIGMTVGDDDEHTQHCWECEHILASRAAIAAARELLEVNRDSK